MKKSIGIIIKVVILVGIIVIAYYIVYGINKPIKFEKERSSRFEQTIARLKDIRTAQIAYKEVKGVYTPSFDTLINFIKTEDIRVVRAIGFVPDTLTEKEALKLGIVSRDTFYVPIMDSLFKHINYPIEDLRFIPTGTKCQFKMDTNSVMTGSGVLVKVFEARVSYWDILDGLDKQLIINYGSEKRQRGHLDVYVNSNKVIENVSLLYGSGPENYEFEANKGDSIVVAYTPGAWPNENSFDIIYEGGELIQKKYYPNSKPDVGWVQRNLKKGGKYTIRLYDDRGDGWYGGISVGSLTESNNNSGNWE